MYIFEIWYCRIVFWLGLEIWTRACQKRETIHEVIADDVTNSGLQYCVFSLQKEKNPFVDERFITSSSSSYVPISFLTPEILICVKITRQSIICSDGSHLLEK